MGMGETFGARLKRMRSLRGLGLRETANKVGISATYLSRIENNAETSPPSEEKILKLAEILEDKFDELMRLAGRVSEEVKDLIKADSEMPTFLRRAKEENMSGATLLKMLDEKKTKK
ncbi:MAG: helix-turn-helix domain-containing protein [Deltaproteobacteria bacterium]|nr:helix-turn-helix domain-containing protein [Deltaproteobacteria bacterium]